VDDCSPDRTSEVTQHWARKQAHRVVLIRHEVNGGVGKAITTGYKAALDDGMEVIAVMAGDGQMDPKELPLILEPVADGKADYSKGNRLTSGVAWEKTPRVRYLGNA
ncbi:MAG: glycosyltransferase family 2 protein, partial [Chloroflexi bacterium]